MSRIAAAVQLRELGRPREALDQLKRALADDPDSVSARLELVWVQIALHDLHAAHRTADEALALAPDNPWALYAKANAVGCSGDASTALDWVDRALELAPWCDAFHSYSGALCLTLRRLDDALTAVDRALQIDAEDAYALDVRVRVLRALHRDTEALVATRAALARHPENPKFLQHLGELALGANDPSTAGAAFRAVLALDPSRADAKSGLVDALRAKSALYRRLTTFLRWTDRSREALKSKRGKIALGVGVGACFVIASCVKDAAMKGLAFLPVTIALIVVSLWFVLYVATRFVLPMFLVPVMFDSMGKHALKETLAAKWKRGGPKNALAIGMVVIGVFASRWPWILVPTILCLPFLVVHRCRPSRVRTVLFGATWITAITGAIGTWKVLDTGPTMGWSTQSNEDAIPWIFLSAVLAIGIGIAASIVQRREQACAAAQDPFADV